MPQSLKIMIPFTLAFISGSTIIGAGLGGIFSVHESYHGVKALFKAVKFIKNKQYSDGVIQLVETGRCVTTGSLSLCNMMILGYVSSMSAITFYEIIKKD